MSATEAMTFEQAEAALDAAFDADGMNPETGNSTGDWKPNDGFDPANQGLVPQGTPAPSTDATPAPAVEPVVPAQPAPTEDIFAERFDPNSLPPELVPAYRLMQADYTRKRQQDAEAVRLYEQYQGVDLGAAAELLQTVQSPEGLLSFVQEASAWLAEQGVAEFEDPNYEYDYEDKPESAALKGTLDSLVDGDPSLAPLAEAVTSMQQKLDRFESTQSERLAAEREEHQLLQAMGELQRQENIIRGSNPEYSDEDVEAIYELASFYDGDLLQAQESYEGQFARRLGRYVRHKGTAVPGVTPIGAPTGAAPAQLNYDPSDLKDAHRAAMETLRLIESQPEM